ncbi:MAG: AraC family transcriptional regulator [Paraprevotella sp.]|nr:AraC family transcriptional regulator [Paraprevotella sp.]
MPRIKEGFKGGRIIVLPGFLVDELKRDPLGRELYITDIGYYPHATYHYCERSEEDSEEFVLIYCVEGEGWFELDGRRYDVRANQFFILPKYKAHVYGSKAGNPWTIYWIHFDGAKAAYFSMGFDKPHDISPAEHSRIQERLGLFEEIYSSVSSGYDKNYMLYATTSLFHFLGSMKYLGEYRECHVTEVQRKQDVVQRAVHFMQENLNKKLSLSDIAREVKLSPSYFSNVFEGRTGTPPLRYLGCLRMQEACRYLDFTDLKISQISPLVGYEDSLYFSRQFTKYMGISPSEYKAKKKG